MPLLPLPLWSAALVPLPSVNGRKTARPDCDLSVAGLAFMSDEIWVGVLTTFQRLKSVILQGNQSCTTPAS